MKKVIVFGASNSKKSINKQFATYAASLLSNVEIEVLDLNDFDLPIYNIDIETEQGIHPEAYRFQQTISNADALIISLAEHNGSYSAVFKNIYDWASRVNQKVWANKPMLLLSTSPGGRGGTTVLKTAKNSFPYFGAQIVGSLALPSFYENFKDGTLHSAFKIQLSDQVVQLQNALN